jgi:hypothetical protein
VRLVLVADRVLTDGAHQLVILIVFKQLWLSRWVALKSKQVLFRVDGNSRDAIC